MLCMARFTTALLKLALRCPPSISSRKSTAPSPPPAPSRLSGRENDRVSGLAELEQGPDGGAGGVAEQRQHTLPIRRANDVFGGTAGNHFPAGACQARRCSRSAVRGRPRPATGCVAGQLLHRALQSLDLGTRWSWAACKSNCAAPNWLSRVKVRPWSTSERLRFPACSSNERPQPAGAPHQQTAHQHPDAQECADCKPNYAMHRVVLRARQKYKVPGAPSPEKFPAERGNFQSTPLPDTT